MIGEGKRLYKLGMAIHWLKANSKQPLESGWTKGERKTWQELKDTYRYGLNVGVRLGKASKFGDGTYLAVIDCDVKSDDPKHLKEMEKALAGLITVQAPQVTSGRGNGSRHIYIRVKKPRGTFKYTQSPHKVQVLMPSVKPTAHERQQLKDHEIKAGVRLRAAWEIGVMGEGGQVVLPPSIHPDTGNTYEWEYPLEAWEDMPLIDMGEEKATAKSGAVVEDFEAVEVDLVGSELPDTTFELIVNGEGCTDRSAALFTATIAMRKARFTDNEILSVLTDKTNYLGDAAYTHANTTSRKRAAQWLAKYTLLKVKNELDAARVFADEVVIDEGTRRDIAKQKKSGKPISEEWQTKIEREGGKPEGRPKATLKNIMLILKSTVSPKVFKFDSFALRVSHGADTPWDTKTGDAIRDVDAISVKYWLSVHHRFEPSVPLVWEAMLKIAEQNRFHPIQDYLRALPKWDGEPRIAGWLKRHFHAEGPEFYLDEVFEKWLVAAVTRVFEPGAKFDWMLILEGNQDIGKSSFVQMLASPKHFIDRLGDLADKDAAQVLQGIWLVEMGELKELKKNEIETVKGFITRQVDKYRPSYGRASIEAPRQCVFAGSTNSEKYLKDDTGNRRFVPVALKGHLDFAQLEGDRDMIWAEALSIYDSGFAPTGELSKAAKEYLKSAHAVRMTEDDSDVMRERISDFMEVGGNDGEGNVFNFEKFRLLDLFADFAPLKDWVAGGWNLQLAAKAVKQLKGDSRLIHGKNVWRIPPPNPTPLLVKKKKTKPKIRDNY